MLASSNVSEGIAMGIGIMILGMASMFMVILASWLKVQIEQLEKKNGAQEKRRSRPGNEIPHSRRGQRDRPG